MSGALEHTVGLIAGQDNISMNVRMEIDVVVYEMYENMT